MCEQRRGTFQRVRLDEDGTVANYISINLREWKAIIVAIVAVLTFIGTIVSAVVWSNHAVAEISGKVAAEEFSHQLDLFHEKAVPEIDRMIDAKIRIHTLTAEGLAIERITALETARAVAERDRQAIFDELRFLRVGQEELLRRVPKNGI